MTGLCISLTFHLRRCLLDGTSSKAVAGVSCQGNGATLGFCSAEVAYDAVERFAEDRDFHLLDCDYSQEASRFYPVRA